MRKTAHYSTLKLLGRHFSLNQCKDNSCNTEMVKLCKLQNRLRVFITIRKNKILFKTYCYVKCRVDVLNFTS